MGRRDHSRDAVVAVQIDNQKEDVRQDAGLRESPSEEAISFEQWQSRRRRNGNQVCTGSQNGNDGDAHPCQNSTG